MLQDSSSSKASSEIVTDNTAATRVPQQQTYQKDTYTEGETAEDFPVVECSYDSLLEQDEIDDDVSNYYLSYLLNQSIYCIFLLVGRG